MISSCVCCEDRIGDRDIDIGDKEEVDCGISDLTMDINDDESESSGETEPITASVNPGEEMGVGAFTAMLERMQQEDPAALQLLLASRGSGKRSAEATDSTNQSKNTRVEEMKRKKTKLCQLDVDQRLPYEKESAVTTFILKRMFRGLKYISKKELALDPRYVGMLFKHLNITEARHKERYRLNIRLVIYKKIAEHRNNSKGNIIRRFKKERTKGKFAVFLCNRLIGH
jgi:hypothetical protein